MTQTPQEIFDMLLAQYEKAERCLISEFSGTIDDDNVALQVEVEGWRKCFRNASAQSRTLKRHASGSEEPFTTAVETDGR